MKIAKSTVKT
jgi:DNA helicase HerA-like ATPase